MLGLMSWALFLAVIIWGEAWERITGRETYQWKKDALALADAGRARDRRQDAPARGRYAACPGAHWREARLKALRQAAKESK